MLEVVAKRAEVKNQTGGREPSQPNVRRADDRSEKHQNKEIAAGTWLP